jgi:hypothetical protein
MPLRWDALLARHTAAELAQALVGHRVVGLRLDGSTRELALLLDDRALLWSLHPSRGWPRVVGPLSPADDDLDVRGRVLAVDAPPDERLLRMALAHGERSTTLVIELLGNQWNALVIEGEPPVIRHVLWRREGARVQRVGEPYRWPRAVERAGLAGDVSLERWLDTLEPLPEGEREGVLVRTFAWTSPLNAATVLGAPDPQGGPSGLRAGYARWHEMASGPSTAKPVLLEVDGARQPYPFPLAGTPSRATDSLLAGFEAVAAAALGGDPVAPTFDPALLSRLEGALRRAAGRVAKLEREIADLPDPVSLRAIGDLVLARYADIPHGAAQARLTGFDGASVEVELDPAEPPHANAARYYREATKAERAAERLPTLLEQARATHARLEALTAMARAGTLAPEEARAALGGASSARTRSAVGERGPTLPYRVFRSSGGLEIRVGRGARHNDELTFRHSSPGDVWLHARHVGGAHVILRWPGPGNPPARDLAEAATLAALHSKARTSGSVPVDWTLRKYVRKPRKSPPGRVAVERVETLFVRPEPSLLEALAVPQEL